jgi:predicted house-cleaning noncanonical NTP pyrophosphatase (MazG superfamily)
VRIVGYIEHPIIKITVMQMNNRFVLKLEANMLEQTYKFHEDDNLRTLADIEKMVDETFLQECLKRFSDMNKSRGEMYQRNIV